MTQWIRKIGLTVTGGEKALDLSELQIKFRTTQLDMDGGYPPGAEIRIYNLSDETAKKVQDEFTEVILQAGYVNGDYGVIFKCTIKMIRSGRLNAIDSFLDIFAADGDQVRYAVANDTLAAGWKPPDVAKKLNDSTSPTGVQTDPAGLTGGVVGIRGKVMWGLAMNRANDLAVNNKGTYSIINGKLVFTPLTGYRAGEIVILNSNTGMIGVPEATLEGVEVACLINPKIQLGGRVQINNADINQTTVKEPGYPRFGSTPYYASVTADGIYRVLVIEHMGDTRGQEWYTFLTCLALDKSASPGESVSAYGSKGVPAKASSN
jgi:hypothetical protein